MSNKRLYIFDNAKFILITLVLIGHFIELLIKENNIAKSLYIFIYCLHMPAFIFIAGYFTNINFKFKFYLWKNIKRLLLPYFIFQILYLVFNAAVKEYKLILNFKRPFWILWFLISLFFWRVLLYFTEKSKISGTLIILLASAAALAVGFLDEFGRIYSSSRTAVFLPFFLLGYYFKMYFGGTKINDFFSVKNKKTKLYIFLIYSAEVILIYFFFNNINLEILYGAHSYLRLELNLFKALLSRFTWISLSLSNIFLFFRIIPAERTVISAYGARSIYPYLLHGFLIIILEKYDLFSAVNSNFRLIIYLMLAVFLTWLLSTKKARNIFQYILEF